MSPRVSPSRPPVRGLLSSLLLLAVQPFTHAAELVPIPDHGVRLAPGFTISLFADHDLAPDVYAMTLDVEGRPVITSAGYIRTLHDTDGDGRADKAVEFATTKSGGMGLCFDGRDLLFHGDGALWRFKDVDGDGVADGPPEKVGTFKGGEHGGHAMRKGPDGWWYFIGGNNTEFRSEHATLPGSPVKVPEAGALMRFSPDLKRAEILAHGFRNPYDFDFNAAGEIFHYDSDVEREFFLPWYTPTRLYHVAHGMHHGWRLPGHLRSWDRPGHYADSVDWLAEVGRGSPTGVTMYRHTQFPERYRGGLFYLDWTFGRIWFTPLTRRGAGYEAKPEVFLEPLGAQGFAPTDVCVAPDGSLFISIGGRRTRGAVFRIHANNTQPSPAPADELAAVLQAPQPLDAWSRARWEPVARRLGAPTFAAAVGNEALSEADRVRAIEVLTDVFSGLPAAAERAGLGSGSPLVRARTAWAIGRVEKPIIGFQLLSLLHDADPLVRRCALETLADHLGVARPSMVGAFLPENLNHADKRVRLAAARLLAAMPDKEWEDEWKDRNSYGANAALSATLAAIWRSPDTVPHVGAAETALAVFTQSKHDDTRTAAIRLIIRALGDWNLHRPSIESFTGYEFPQALAAQADLTGRIRAAVRAVYPSAGEGALDATFNVEAARLLAMLEDDDPSLPAKVLAQITSKSSATEDFHHLVVLAKLRGKPDGLAGKIADAILGLDAKLAGAQQRSKQTWGERLVEVAGVLQEKHPALGDALATHPRLVRAAHVALAGSLGPDARAKAAQSFLRAVERDKEFEWSPELVRLLAPLAEKDVLPLFRKQWSQRGLREELFPHLIRAPERRDVDLFLEALDTLPPKFTGPALDALTTVSVESSPATLAPVLRLLDRLTADPKQAEARRAVLTFLTRQTGQPFVFAESATDAGALRETYAPVFEWFAAAHPQAAGSLRPGGNADAGEWTQVLQRVAWDQGDATRGGVIFRERACQTCHAAANTIGPDLAGVTGRFSKEDLFHSIVFPNRDIAPPYRPAVFVMRDGQTHTGMVAFNSADGVILQTGPATTVRLDEKDIVSQREGDQSLMPAGLLDGLQPGDLADLYAYLKELQPGAMR